MITKSNRSLSGILLALGLVCLIATIVLAADFNFAGTWRGELAAGGPGGGGAPGGAGGRAGGAGGRGGAGGGAASGPQKITLRVKVNKEKATGNFTMGSSSPEDIKDGRIAGNKLNFKTGLPPAAIYIYDAVLNGEELSVTRAPEGGRGGRPQTFTLKRK